MVSNKESARKHSERPLGVLMLPQTCPPDMGGVETHVLDLIAALKDHPAYRTWIVAYKPIVTAIPSYLPVEIQGNVTIRRFWWLGGNLFRKLESSPPLVFLYIVPYFMVRLFFYLLPRVRQIDVIHAHGINMAVVGLVFAKLFHKRVVFQSHALYTFKPGSLFAKVAAFVLTRMDAVIALCEKSRQEVIGLGVDPKKTSLYWHWVDLNRFTPAGKRDNPVFTAFFAGRLMKIKGEGVVIELARRFPQVHFKIAGCGPNENAVREAASALSNVEFLGRIDNTKIHEYYQDADVFLVPSQYEEGFGRGICEALACGTPVLASSIGGIPDAMDNTVGVLCDTSVESFAFALQRMIADPAWYQDLKSRTRPYAEKKFSVANAEMIFSKYRNNEQLNEEVVQLGT